MTGLAKSPEVILKQKIVVGILAILVFVLFSKTDSNQNNNSGTGSPQSVSVTSQKQLSEQKLLSVNESGKKVFNDLGWAIYLTQFENPKPNSDTEIARRFENNGVTEQDVKFILYDLGKDVYLDTKRQAIYDDYTVGLWRVTPKTELAAEAYRTKFIQQKINSKEIDDINEFKAIEMRGLLTNVPISSPKPTTAPKTVSATPRPTSTTTPVSQVQPSFPSREQVEATVKANAMKKWGDDYSMVQFEIERQLDAYSWLVQQSQYPNIMVKAMSKWRDDYSMIKFEYERQVKSFQKL